MYHISTLIGYKDDLNLLDFDREFLLDLLRCSCVVAGPGVGSPWSASNGQAPRILLPTTNWEYVWEMLGISPTISNTNVWLCWLLSVSLPKLRNECLKNFLRNEFWLLVSMLSWCLIKWVEPQLRVFEIGRNRWQDVCSQKTILVLGKANFCVSKWDRSDRTMLWWNSKVLPRKPMFGHSQSGKRLKHMSQMHVCQV
jgi:hypothetical protein